jgi:LacI family transcriptional regulator
MRKQRSNLIAIVHFGAGIEAAHKANLNLAREVNAAGYDYLALDMNWHGGSVDRTLEELIQARVEGVLISHIQEVFGEEHVRALQQAGIPVVSINGARREGVPLICDNAAKAFAQLTSHLLGMGHRRIIQLLPTVDLSTANSGSRGHRARQKGFRSAFTDSGRWMQISEEDFSMEFLTRGEVVGITVDQNTRHYEHLEHPVYHFCQRLFATGSWPDAIVCPNDQYAVEAIMAAQEVGLSVPGDLAVTGYDNDSLGAFPAMGLTTAEQDLENICVTGVRTLIAMRDNPGLPAVTQSFDSQLILRSSCRFHSGCA